MKDKVVLIVGATSIIGRACTHLLANNGAKLMLLGRDETKLKALTNEIRNSVDFHYINICSETDVKAALKHTLESYSRIDALVLNVAIYPWKSIDDLSLNEWKDTLDVNLTGAFLMTKACFQIMKKQRSGSIVFVSSLAGENIGLPYMSAYASSKAGLNGLMRTAAIEFAPDNITVNSISPGKIYDPTTLSKEERETKLASIPLGRFIEPSDIAHTVKFLISDHAKNITGQNFIIDGGQSVLG